MSGPVTSADAEPVADTGHPSAPCVEVTEAHQATVGRFAVRRLLPRRSRRTVGAWCFADHIGPAAVTERAGLDIGPHPHIGLQTVTWLVEGEALHRDSLGSDQVIRPGELNLMTAGGGVAHSEEATGAYRGALHGVQLWVAQPERTRHGDPGFAHHSDLPAVELDHADVTVIAGDLAGTTIPARHDTPLVGLALALRPGTTTLPLRREFEHAALVLDGGVHVAGARLEPGRLGYLGTGRDELTLATHAPTHALLIGGVPFDEPLLMWWNFVARDRTEMEAAYRDWRDGSDRFGRVASALPTIAAPAPYWRTGG